MVHDWVKPSARISRFFDAFHLLFVTINTWFCLLSIFQNSSMKVEPAVASSLLLSGQRLLKHLDFKLICLFNFILYVPVQQSFSYARTGFPGLNQY